MSHRNTPVNRETGTFIIDGITTTIRAYPEEVHKKLVWNKKLEYGIRYPHDQEVELNPEYF